MKIVSKKSGKAIEVSFLMDEGLFKASLSLSKKKKNASYSLRKRTLSSSARRRGNADCFPSNPCPKIVRSSKTDL